MPRTGVFSAKAFHEKAGRSQGNSGFIASFLFFVAEKKFSSPSSRCRHASIRTLEERLFRSVHVGRSRFSRRCHLISDLSFHSRVERGPRPLTQSPELGFGLLSFVFSLL